MIPTRFIEKDEYDKLLDMEEGYVIIHQLDAMDFIAPKTGSTHPETVTTEHVHILFLNATEPCIYMEKGQGVAIIILPKHDELSYDVLQEIHPTKGSWAYRLSPHNWQAEDWDNHQLMYSDYWFKNTTIPKFDLADERSH